MPITIELYVEHPDLALTHAIRVTDADIGVVSDAGTDPDNDVYFFWVEATEYAPVETAFEEDPTIEAFEHVLTTDDRRTYAITYDDDEASLISPAITRLGGLILESRSHGNGWLLSLLFEDHETLKELHEYVNDTKFRVDIFELRHAGAPDDHRQFGLTERQAEALICAYVHGYYDHPRKISQAELGSILGISETAVSGRLRRGSARLTEAVLEE